MQNSSIKVLETFKLRKNHSLKFTSKEISFGSYFSKIYGCVGAGKNLYCYTENIIETLKSEKFGKTGSIKGLIIRGFDYSRY